MLEWTRSLEPITIFKIWIIGVVGISHNIV